MSAESSKSQLSLDLSELMEISGDKQRIAFLRRRKLLRAATVLELNAATQKEFRANTKIEPRH